MIPAKRRDPVLGLANQVLDHAGRNGVAEQRRVERRLVATGARLEPVALHDTVVERRVGVDVADIGVVQRFIGGLAVSLRAAGRQQLAILPIAHFDGLTGRQRDGRKFRVGRGQGRVGILRHTAEPARQRQQFLALLVQDVRLQAEHLFDREAIQGQVWRRRHPLTHRVDGQLQQFWLEPRHGLLPLGKQ